MTHGTFPAVLQKSPFGPKPPDTENYLPFRRSGNTTPDQTTSLPSISPTAPGPAPDINTEEPPKKFPSFSATSAIDIMEMGITREMYRKVARVAKVKKCIIMIRKTNKGSVLPLSTGKAVGKKLPTKGKSSDAFFTKGSIPFFAQMAKKLNPDNWFAEQTNLISVLSEETSGETKGQKKYAYIPKLLTEDYVKNIVLRDETIKLDSSTLAYTDITKLGDLIAGKKKNVKYRLLNTTWGAVNNLVGTTFQGKLVPPYLVDKSGKPIDIKDETVLYRVYMQTEDTEMGYPGHFQVSVEGQVNLDKYASFLPVTPAPEGTTKKINNQDTPVTKFFNVAWDTWKKNMCWNCRMDINMQTDVIEENAPLLAPKSLFREVRVLAVLTSGTPNKGDKTDIKKKYFEVVADYDLFMIAPKIELFKSGWQKKSDDTANKLEVLEKEWWLNNKDEASCKIDSEYLPISDLGEKASPETIAKNGLTANSREAKGGKMRYGIVSDFELKVRKAINGKLKINAVQHGVETANLFYTSDLKDPVIPVFPEIPAFTSGDKYNPSAVNSGSLFFLSIKMLLELIAGKEGELNATNVDPDMTIFKGKKDSNEEKDKGIWNGVNLFWKDSSSHSFSEDYAIIFNLNWGTDAYYRFNNSEYSSTTVSPKRKEEIKAFSEQQYDNVFNNVVGQYNKILDFKNIFKVDEKLNVTDPIFNPALPLPFSIKAFYIFLYLDYMRIKKNSLGKRSLLTYKNNYKFVKKIMFLGEFYKSVFKETSTFAGLCGHDGNDEMEIKKLYWLAINGIKNTLEFYKMNLINREIVRSDQDVKLYIECVGEGLSQEDREKYDKESAVKIPSVLVKNADGLFYSPFISALVTYIDKTYTWLDTEKKVLSYVATEASH